MTEIVAEVHALYLYLLGKDVKRQLLPVGPFTYKVSKGQSMRMTIDVTRRNNLLILLKQEEDKNGSWGAKSRLAKAISRPPDLISRWIGNNKRIGDDIARHIEEMLGLPQGWMDTQQHAAGHADVAGGEAPIDLAALSELQRRYASASDDIRAAIDTLLTYDGDPKAAKQAERAAKAIRTLLDD